MSGKLVISLDFELVWGIFDYIDLPQKQAYFENTLSVIPEMLKCFEQHQMEVTWATVGMLFNRNWEEWLANRPENLPSYQNKKLDAYAYGLAHQDSGFDRYFFAPDLIQRILQTPGQELATHTYSHYYCLENGQTAAQFADDLDLAVKMAKQVGVALQSMVFPRNQWNEEYLTLCAERGITQLRSNPAVWYWQDTASASLATKLFRTGDAYFPLGAKSYTSSAVTSSMVTAQPASRFLRPHHSVSILNQLRLSRIKNEMLLAAKKGEIYHLWWHPHNFGDYPKQSMEALIEIAKWYIHLHQKYGFESVTMATLPQKI